MRVLIATTGNDGHYGPLLPIARALAGAGHEVRVAAPASYAGAVQRSGFVHVPFDDAPAQLIGPVMARLPQLSPEEADQTVVREVFGRIDAQAALPRLLAAVDAWRPDVLLREPAEFGSLAAAVRAGTPHLQVSIGMTEMSTVLADLLTAPLTELARLAGLPEDALTSAVATEPILSSVPAVLDRAGDLAPEQARVALRYRDEVPPATSGTLPVWGDPDLPLVYVTFGSVTGALPPFAGAFQQALDGLAAPGGCAAVLL